MIKAGQGTKLALTHCSINPSNRPVCPWFFVAENNSFKRPTRGTTIGIDQLKHLQTRRKAGENNVLFHFWVLVGMNFLLGEKKFKRAIEIDYSLLLLFFKLNSLLHSAHGYLLRKR